MEGKVHLDVAVKTANTGLDAIKRAPIVDTDTGIKCIRIQDISQKKAYPDWGFTKVLERDFSKFQLKQNDILIARTGASIGVNRIIAEDQQAVFNNGLIRIRVNEDRFFPRFIYHVLQSPSFKEHIYAIAFATAAQPNMKIRDFLKFEIPILPYEDQKQIAHILGTLDDKIELNRQMNATLEAMAQALFKSWFVDFDPVIDNALAAGNPLPEPLHNRAETRKALGDKRKPLPEAIQKQFPSRFVFSEEMGWIPEGWGVSTVGEQVETTGGGTPSTKEPIYWEDGTHAFCTPKDMSLLGSMVLMDTERHLTGAGVNKISSGQLPPGTVLMSSRAPIGYLAISDIPVSVNQGIIAMLPSDKYGSLFLLCWAHFNMGKIEDRANGSTFLEISKKNYRPIPFVVPGDGLLDAFNDQAQAIYDKLLLTAEGTESLTRLRDPLLPKLLSGQLRIPDAEKLVADAV